MAAFQIRQVANTTLVMCGQSRSSLLSADLVIEAAKVGGCYQIDDVTLRLSQAECDTRLIAPLLFSERSEALWSGIKGIVCFFCCVCVLQAVSVLYFIGCGKVLLTLFMSRCGNKPTALRRLPVQPTGQPTWEVREVWRTNIESVQCYTLKITVITYFWCCFGPPWIFIKLM